MALRLPADMLSSKEKPNVTAVTFHTSRAAARQRHAGWALTHRA